MKCPDKKFDLNKGGLDYFGEKLGNYIKDTWIRKTFYLTQLTSKNKDRATDNCFDLQYGGKGCWFFSW